MRIRIGIIQLTIEQNTQICPNIMKNMMRSILTKSIMLYLSSHIKTSRLYLYKPIIWTRLHMVHSKYKNDSVTQFMTRIFKISSTMHSQVKSSKIIIMLPIKMLNLRFTNASRITQLMNRSINMVNLMLVSALLTLAMSYLLSSKANTNRMVPSGTSASI